MDREDADDVDPAAVRKQRAESLHRRKLGQSGSAAELTKKSGYLLKKGPLKVTLICLVSEVMCQALTGDRRADRP